MIYRDPWAKPAETTFINPTFTWAYRSSMATISTNAKYPNCV